MSTGPTQILTEGSQMYEDFPVGNLLDSHFALPRARKPNNNKRKMVIPGGGEIDQGDDDDNDDGEIGMMDGDDEVTEDDVQNIVKMTEYIEKVIFSSGTILYVTFN
jgi:hypothetical protein